MIDNVVIVRDGLWRTVDGYEVAVRPTGCEHIRVSDVITARVRLDGVWAKAEQTGLVPGCDELPVDSLATREDLVWHVHETGMLAVHGIVGPVPGTDHNVAVEIAYRIGSTGEVHTDRYVTIETAA